ncbi:MAG: hypothetical protein P0Y55_13915 [Candidatus Cohnella colombiensis]|uniref:Uncharacterized protein n=1 Tax=Candidatus Cohnella colombiensis TaxID=3121368 RepID=A0AA95JFE3_9BACL|nr:MAG: hypothetical protein P0Y55_13915 [Cohnella sp.]
MSNDSLPPYVGMQPVVGRDELELNPLGNDFREDNRDIRGQREPFVWGQRLVQEQASSHSEEWEDEELYFLPEVLDEP